MRGFHRNRALSESPTPRYGHPVGGKADRFRPRFHTARDGRVAEWSIAPVLKTGDAQASVGSNPTPSANLFFFKRLKNQLSLWFSAWLSAENPSLIYNSIHFLLWRGWVECFTLVPWHSLFAEPPTISDDEFRTGMFELSMPLAGLSFKAEEAKVRPPFSDKWISKKLLAPGALMGLNREGSDNPFSNDQYWLSTFRRGRPSCPAYPPRH